jgi:thiol-disulfide isomerase/thioredoxin
MTAFLLAARLLLAGVFAVAGVAKLADRSGSRQAVIEFGVPKALAAPLGLLLPLAELAVTGALIPTSTALWGAVGALALLLLFCAGIGINLARGKKPDCHCFGQLHSAPAGWKTLARNGVLAALAGFLVWQGWEGEVGPSAVGWIGALSTLQLLGLVGGLIALGLLVGQWWFLLNLMRQNGRLLVRLEGLEEEFGSSGAAPSQNGVAPQPQEGLSVGVQAPAFTLEGLYGEALTLDSLRSSGKPVMLLFTDPNCGPCMAMLPEIGRWQEEYTEKLSIALISRGTAEENKAKASEHGVSRVLLQNDWEISEAYEVRGTPSALVVHPDGTIGSPVAGGAEAIKSLTQRAVDATSPNAPLLPGAPAPAHNGNGGPCPKCGKRHPTEDAPAMPQTLAIGEQAPEVKLEDLSGNEVSLKEDFGGDETLVLFWNPGCGFCQQMLDDLKEWEQNPPQGAPKLLMVSAGTEEANKQMGLESPVVLDQHFSIGRQYGAGGTPSAVLVDAEGKVASEVAIGAPAVLELAVGGRTEA